MTWTVFTIGNPDAQRFTDRAPAKTSLEERAHKALLRAGYDSLWLAADEPQYRYNPRGRRNQFIGIRTVPLIPGYAFALNPVPAAQPAFELAIRRLTMPARQGHIRVVSGVLGVVSSGAHALEHLRTTPVAPVVRLRAGDRAHIIAGPLVQAEPVVLEVVTKRGARVSLGSLVVEIPLGQLEAA